MDNMRDNLPRPWMPFTAGGLAFVGVVIFLVMLLICLVSKVAADPQEIVIDSTKWFDASIDEASPAVGPSYWNSSGLFLIVDSTGGDEARIIIGSHQIHDLLSAWTVTTVDSFKLYLMKDIIRYTSAGETLYVALSWVMPVHAPETDTGITWNTYATDLNWDNPGGDVTGIISDTTAWYGQTGNANNDSIWCFTVKPDANHPGASDFLNNLNFPGGGVVRIKIWGNLTGSNPVEGAETIEFFSSEITAVANGKPYGKVWINGTPVEPFVGTGRRRAALQGAD